MSSPFAALGRYSRLAREFMRIGVIRKSQFRAEFISQVVMDTFWYGLHVATFEILFAHTDEIAGWTRDEVRVFLGCLFVSDAFWMVWMSKVWHFGRELKDGKLDSLRVRPASPIFLYFFQSFSLEACVNALMAFGWLFFAVSRLPEGFAAHTMLMLVWAIVLACWTRVVLSVLYSTAEIYVLNSDLSNVAWEISMTLSDRPADVFPLRLKQLLLWWVPVAGLSSLPASMVLGRIGPLEALGHSAWLTVFGLAVFRFWRWSFRKYESALG